MYKFFDHGQASKEPADKGKSYGAAFVLIGDNSVFVIVRQ